MKAKKIALLLAMLAFLSVTNSGCYQDPIGAKLSGTWGIEHGEKLTRRVNEVSDPAADEEDLSQRMMLSFYSSGGLQTKTRIAGQIREKNGSWNVVDYDEETDRMTIECELFGQQTEHEVQFIEQDLIRLVPPNMAGTKSKLTFRRQ